MKLKEKLYAHLTIAPIDKDNFRGGLTIAFCSAFVLVLRVVFSEDGEAAAVTILRAGVELELLKAGTGSWRLEALGELFGDSSLSLIPLVRGGDLVDGEGESFGDIL